MQGEKHWNWKGGGELKYSSIHAWNNRHFPKTKACTNCQKKGKTVWALIHGKQHGRMDGNYTELCQSCHIKYDMTEEWSKKSLATLKSSYTHTHPIQDKDCEECLKTFAPKKKRIRFCSNSCSAKWRTENLPESMLRTRGTNGTFTHLALNKQL